jgi:polygalacturonase
VKDSTFRNNDGCNIVDCENAIVENCDIDALDDGICLKGYTAEGCRNVVIRNNRVRSLCNGIKAGTDSSGGFQNILIENNVIWQTGIAGIALELVDGGVMRNVVVRNITMDVVETPIFIKLGDRNRPIYTEGGDVRPGVGTLRDIHISGIRAKVNDAKKYTDAERAIHDYTPYASSVTGIPGHFVERLHIHDVDIEILGGFPVRTLEDARRTIEENSTKYPENRMFGVLPAHAFYIRHAKDIHLSGIRIAMRQKDARPAFVLDDVHASTFTNIETRGVSPVPPFRIGKNCTGVKVVPAPVRKNNSRS